jgi:hypothetical protein
MVDVYTKAVLTVIAVALSAIAIRSAVPSALAIGDGCGSALHACLVRGKVEVYGTVTTSPY